MKWLKIDGSIEIFLNHKRTLLSFIPSLSFVNTSAAKAKVNTVHLIL